MNSTRRTFREGRSSSDDQKRIAASCPDGIGIAYYLGLPVVVLRDLGGGWVEAIYPDNENPGRAHKRQKPYTYTGRGPDAWCGRMWRDQLRFPALLEAAR